MDKQLNGLTPECTNKFMDKKGWKNGSKNSQMDGSPMDAWMNRGNDGQIVDRMIYALLDS